MFGDVPGLGYVMQWIPYVIGACVLVLALVIFWGPIVKRNVARQTFTGMTVQDVEKMRRDGLISEEEYKRIKHKTAERELDTMRHQTDAERERQILAEAVINPDAARKLLPPEAIAHPKPLAPVRQPAEPKPAAQQPAAGPQPTSGLFDWGDPLAQVGETRQPNEVPSADGGVTHPHPGKIRVPPPRVEPKEPAGELEILLQKGAITREDYERLKSLIKK